MTAKPRVLFVGRSRYALPLVPTQRLKWDAVGKELDYRVLASSPDSSRGDLTFLLRPRTALDGLRFWLSLPGRVRRESHRFAPDAIVAQSPFEAAAALAARTGVPVIVELHGDWRTFARLYGSPARRVVARAADAVGTWAVRNAAKVRSVSPYTTRLAREAGREPASEFPAFMDLEPFAAPAVPLPAEPAALFVGVLELYKNIDGLAAAWRLAQPRVPGRPAAACRQRHPRGRRARRSSPTASRRGMSASTRQASQPHSIRRACSCCRQDRREWGAS